MMGIEGQEPIFLGKTIKPILAQRLLITILAPNCEVSKWYQDTATKLWDKLIKVNEDGGVDNQSIQPTIF